MLLAAAAAQCVAACQDCTEVTGLTHAAWTHVQVTGIVGQLLGASGGFS
jgi:hypothetical protein